MLEAGDGGQTVGLGRKEPVKRVAWFGFVLMVVRVGGSGGNGLLQSLLLEGVGQMWGEGFGILVGYVSGENAVADVAGHDDVGSAEAYADALGGAVRQVDGAVEPPGAVVVPQVVVRTRGLLAAGEGRGGYGHGDVVVFGSRHRDARKSRTPVLMTSERASEYSGETLVGQVCLVLLPHAGSFDPVAPWRLC